MCKLLIFLAHLLSDHNTVWGTCELILGGPCRALMRISRRGGVLSRPHLLCSPYALFVTPVTALEYLDCFSTPLRHLAGCSTSPPLSGWKNYCSSLALYCSCHTYHVWPSRVSQQGFIRIHRPWLTACVYSRDGVPLCTHVDVAAFLTGPADRCRPYTWCPRHYPLVCYRYNTVCSVL